MVIDIMIKVGAVSIHTNVWLVVSFFTQGEYKAQKEAVWAITNLTAGGTIDQIVEVVRVGALKPLCDLLVVKETKIITVILDAVLNVLHVSQVGV